MNDATTLPSRLALLAVVVLLGVALAGCAVVVRSDTGYTWWYYPEQDVYYSPTIDAWAYWTGKNWVVVQTRPGWFEPKREVRVIRIRYRGPRPWTEWHTHRRLR